MLSARRIRSSNANHVMRVPVKLWIPNSRAGLLQPQVEFRARSHMAQDAAFRVRDQRVAPQVLADDRHFPSSPRRVQAVGLQPQYSESTVPDRGGLTAYLITHARLQDDPQAQCGRQVHVFATCVRVEVLEDTKPDRAQLYAGLYGAEHRIRKWGSLARRKILTPPFPRTPQTRIGVRVRVQRDSTSEPDLKQMVPRTVHQGVVTKLKDALVRDLPVALDRTGGGGLMKRQSQLPGAAIAVG